MRRGRRRAAVLAALGVCALGTSAGSASAGSKLPSTYPNRFCRGTFQARGEPWGYDGRNINCRWQRTWAIAFLADGSEPKHWRCVDLDESGQCDRKHSNGRKWFEFYAED